MSILDFFLFAFIGVAFATDARKSILPNKLTIVGTGVGFLYHCIVQGWAGLLFASTGALTGFVVLLLLYLLGALGAGDVKLFAAIGALMGLTYVVQCMIYSILFAGAIGLLLLLVRKQVFATAIKLANWLFSIVAHGDKEAILGMKHQRNLKFPFMYAVAPGVVVAWFEVFQ
ncbi:prepilin peptidase [Paenibacillus sp. SI8]|uniref:prepilin peptidase n=1 Tax=unclassified Paenibacillus TaxID=185978 RepID=UPI003465554B